MFKRVIACLLMLALAMPAIATMASDQAANTFAVCGCGKIFMPTASSPTLTHDGKTYYCCTKECHAMMAKDPAAAAKMTEKTSGETIAHLQGLHMTVGNVIEVTENGTKAICGCGKEFSIAPTTMYINADGTAYACCTKQCHEMASKDPAGAVKMAEDQMKKHSAMSTAAH